MAEVMTASTGIVGSLTAAGSCLAKTVGAVASFNYQLVTSVFRALSEGCKVITAVSTTLADACGEIFHYLVDVFAECGNVACAFLRLGSKFLQLVYYILSLVICCIIYIGEGIASVIGTCLKAMLLYIGKIGSNMATTCCQVKTAIAEVAPEYWESASTFVNKYTTIVNNSVHNGATYIAATTGAILGTAYESISVVAHEYGKCLTEWCVFLIEVSVHSLSTVVLKIKYAFEYIAIAFNKHVNVDCYMFVFLATTVFISVKVMLDYMNKRDLTLPLPGFRRQTRIRLRNGNHFPAYVIDSSDEEIFGEDDFNDDFEESDELSVTTSEEDEDEFDDSDSVTHEEYEVGSEESDDSLESESGTSVQIQLPPPGGYNLRTRKKSPSPSDQAGASPETRIDDAEEELNRKCVVCQDEPKTVLVLPCKHMCLCVDCAHTIASQRSRLRRVCPLCRGRIQTVMNVYL